MRAPSLFILASLAIGIAPAGAAEPAAAPPFHSPAFILAATDGSPVTDKDYRGKWLLVYFGYTFCPDICPTTLTAIAGALDGLGPRARQVQPLFITIDPARDAPKILAGYVGAIDRRIAPLTGTKAQIAAAARNYGVIYERQDIDDGGYLFDHTSYIYVIDPAGVFVAALSGTSDRATIVRRLLTLMQSLPRKEP